MARRRSNRKPRRRSPKPMVNLLNLAEGFVVSNAATNALFGSDVIPFMTEGWLTKQTTATDNSWELSAAELFSGLTGGSFGISSKFGSSGSLQDALKYNLQRSGSHVATMILAPIAFRVGKKVARQPINRLNRGIKALGLGSTIKI